MNYGNALKTHILEPVISLKKDGRTEYRIQPDTLFTSSFRLVNHGVDNGFGNYDALLGYLENVDAIYLYDNETLLDGIQNIKPYVGFKHFNNTNDFNNCLGQPLSGHKLGFKYAGRSPDVSGEPQQQIIPGNHFVADNSGVKVNSGWLNLRSILPMLEASMYVPTNVFKRLRLVIEYKNESATADNKRPLLCIDEVVNSDKKDAIMREYQGVRFNAIINDTRVVSGGGTGLTTPGQTEVQDTNFLLKGFDNKHLKRCMVVKTPTSSEKQGAYQKQGSKQMLREKFQVRSNGKNLYAGQGVEGEPQILDELTHHYGSCNSITTQLRTNPDASGNAYVASNLVGELSYLGFNVDETIQELQFRYTRTLEHDSDNVGNQSQSVYNQQLKLQFYGECDKQITRQGEDYLVSYPQ